MFPNIIGHRTVCGFLEKSIQSDRVSHAYLFIGPSHVGKMTIAKAYAEALLYPTGAKNLSLESHPDVTHLERPIDEKTGLRKSAISIEQIRALRERLSHTSLFRSWKIALIDEAHTMTAEAANALLKTLEEPRGKTVIILLAGDARFIPRTVRSRAQVIRFHAVPRRVIEAGLRERGIPERRAAEITRFVHGRPGLAVHFAGHPKQFLERIEEIRERAGLISKSIYERIDWIERQSKKIKGNLGEEFHDWRLVIREHLLSELGLREWMGAVPNDGQGLGIPEFNQASLGRWLEVSDRLAEAEDASSHHVDPRLALEHFLLAI